MRKNLEFMYDFARLPKDQQLIKNINSSANRLFYKLKSLDIDPLDISDYNKRYFGNKLANLVNHLKLYSYILSLSLANSCIPISKFVFLDYGSGSGMQCLLAKQLGIGTVIYNDIYDVSCHDAKIIAKSIGNEADYYVQGDIDDLIIFFKENNINCNAIASYDVIEHIYDIEYFFKKISLLSNNSLTIVMSSGANCFNPRIRKRLSQEQIEIEYKDRKKEFGHKERDCLKSYRKVRKEIIHKYVSSNDKEIAEKEMIKLVENTRGMIKTDILKCVDEHLKTGNFPPEPNHPTNTCDPYTGNWAERLMNPNNLIKILLKQGFRVEILAGYYGGQSSILKKFLSIPFNIGIYVLKKQGIRLAPFYTIYGRRD